MALTHAGVGGAQTYTTGNASGTVPHGSPAAGDREVLVVVTKPETMVPGTIAGWTLLNSGTGGTGSFGAGTGPVRITAYLRDVDCSGSEGTSAVTVPFSGNVANSSMWGRILRFTHGAGKGIWGHATVGADNAGSSNWSAAHSGCDHTAGDLVYAGVGTPVATLPTFGSESVTSTGATYTQAFIANVTTTTGNDAGGRLSVFTLTGSCSGTTTHANVLTGTTTAWAGADVLVRVREVTPLTGDATLAETATLTAALGATTKPVNATTLAVTATLSADATVESNGVTYSADSTLSGTATFTATMGAITRTAGASATTTATLTAGLGPITKAGGGTLAAAATLTAEMTVVSPVAQIATGAITVTEASTATAAATKPVAGSLTATAISSASMTVRTPLAGGAAVTVSQTSVASLEQLRPVRTFRPPVITERLDVVGQRSLVRVPTTVGISVLKVGGQYHQVRQPANWEMDQAEAVYLGGRIYTVTPEEADDLRAAGYDVSEQLQPV